MAKSDKYMIFLLSIMTSAGSMTGADGKVIVPLTKRRAMGEALRKRFADHSAEDRQRMVKRVVSGLPPVRNGLELLKLVEGSAQKLATELENDKRKLSWVVRTLKNIAESDGVVSKQEMLVLTSAIRGLGMSEALQVSHDDRSITIARA